MKRLFGTIGVLGATLFWLAALLAIHPFDRANDLLDRSFGALPAWSQVQDLYQDATIQEVSRGDHPLAGFEMLSRNWAQGIGSKRVILMGNSQTQAVSLAPGEAPPMGPEKTYTDLISDRLRGEGRKALFYRLSAGALSYEEMLWYASYLAAKPAIRPNVLLVQLNYQNFANSSIRAGMLEMLEDKGFSDQIQALSSNGRPYSNTFLRALDAFAARAKSKRAGLGQGTLEENAEVGYRLETKTRSLIGKIPAMRESGDAKESFVLMLLRCRSYLFHLRQATQRSLGGPHMEASRAALDSLVELSQRAGIRVILFQAPTNPKVSLYRTKEDDRLYHEFSDNLASRYGITVFDFEHSIPAEHWGMALNGPDPLHLSRTGHQMLAGMMVQQLEQGGI